MNQNLTLGADTLAAEAEAVAKADTRSNLEIIRRLAALEAAVFPANEPETRTEDFRFRLTPGELTRYRRAAADAGLTLSAWLRMRCERL